MARAREAYPKAKIIRNQSNLGYATAANIGIANARGEFVVIMNPDTLVNEHWLEDLLDSAEHHPSGAFFQPKISLMDNPRVLNSAGNIIHVVGSGKLMRPTSRLNPRSATHQVLVSWLG